MKEEVVLNRENISIAHLSEENWRKVNQLMLKKMIGEFSHELLIRPKPIREVIGNSMEQVYFIASNDGIYVYQFVAICLALDHWEIKSGSIEFLKANEVQENISVISFIGHFKEELGLEEPLLSTYLEELTHCLYGMAYIHFHNLKKAAELATADYQEMEQCMWLGHPCFVANSAKIGYDIRDYENFAPEAADPFSLIWLAGHKSCTVFSHIEGISYEALITNELASEERLTFENRLLDEALLPTDYIFIPVHPWQWYNKLSHVFAPEIANNRLVFLGEGKDQYLPQQSIRTMFNVSEPKRCHIKSALSIFNRGFMEGLSANLMLNTPAINDWLCEILSKDSFLVKKKFRILREIATVGYTNANFEKAFNFDTSYKKMLASLWCESPYFFVGVNQNLMNMSALLHKDTEGVALLPELIRRSKISAEEWLYRYVDAYLTPLLHCYYKYDVRFMTHGENLILVLEDFVPVNVLMKNIGEEIAFLGDQKELPEVVERFRIYAPENLRIMSIFTQVFDCFFRFLNAILVTSAVCKEEVFWELVAKVVHTYQEEFPELNDKFEKYNLFAKEIPKTCLNRLQLLNNKKLIISNDPYKSQQFAGTLNNPIHKYQH